MTAERAADAILAAGTGSPGGVRITDATASFPHGRWQRILARLVEAGGSRAASLWCYTRVSRPRGRHRRPDGVTKAGVRHVFVGQESGDQRILDAMKKGTSVDQVKPAVAALARSGVCATFSFIHGFPGEDAASMETTRSMIVHLNDGFESRPPVLHYIINPSPARRLRVAQPRGGDGGDRALPDGGTSAPVGSRAIRSSAACYDTFIAASRKVPRTPRRSWSPPARASSAWEDELFFSPPPPRDLPLVQGHRAPRTAIFTERAVERHPAGERRRAQGA